jgi:omega-6 fatty acid desaturase (delta-12 desaturase)
MKDTNKSIIKSTLKFGKEKVKLSWFHTISSNFLLLGFITLTINMPFLWIRWICSLGITLMIVRTFIIYHDYVHETILRKSKFAKVLFFIYGLYVLAPINVWKRTHNYHHRNNGKFFKPSIGSYPLYSKEKFKRSSRKQKINYLLVRHPLIIFFGYLFTFIYGMCLYPFISHPKKHFDSLLSILFHLLYIFSLYYFFDFNRVLLVVILPHFISSALGAYLFYAQHNFPEAKYKNDQEWSYEFSALESSSYMKMSKFMEWVTGNIGYHHIHHLNPSIPFYRLPETMKAVKYLQNPKTTSLRIKDIISCLRLRVWNEQLNKMSSLDE